MSKLMEITAAKLNPVSSGSHRARGTVVLDGELILRNLKLVKEKGELIIKPPPAEASQGIFHTVALLDDGLRQRIKQRFAHIYKTLA